MAHSILGQISQSVHNNTHYAIMADEVTAGADLGGGVCGVATPKTS